jgi:transcriptional regulator with XRE-family HTH domain
MALKEYYEKIGERSTPKKEFRETIARECGVTEMTVFRWLSGEVLPDKLKREKIAEISGLTVEELFPNIQD